MNKTEYRKYIASSQWQERRKEVLAGQDGQGSWCNRCKIPRWLASIAFDQDLHVHHKSYANIGSERIEDLEILCRRCHDIETFSRSDLRAPKMATCEVCGQQHYNVYSSICRECFRLTTGRIGINLLCVDPSTTSDVWETVVRNFVSSSTFVGPPLHKVMSVFADALAKNQENLKSKDGPFNDLSALTGGWI